MSLPRPLLAWLYNQLELEYLDKERTFSDTTQLLLLFPSLRPKTDVYTHTTGHSELLLNINGPLPTIINGHEYGIPIEIWVPKQYPMAPPILYVKPTESMLIMPGPHVDSNGLASFDWEPVQTLCWLTSMFAEIFSQNCPVYSRPAPAYDALPHGLAPKPAYKPKPMYKRAAPIQNTPSIMDGEVGPPLPESPRKNDGIVQVQAAYARLCESLKHDEIDQDCDALHNTGDVLDWLYSELGKEEAQLKAAIERLESNNEKLAQKIESAKKVTAQAKSTPVDELVVAETPAGNQLLRAAAEDVALGDTIYALGKSVDRELVSVDVFIKHVRTLARQQFMARYLAQKCAV